MKASAPHGYAGEKMKRASIIAAMMMLAATSCSANRQPEPRDAGRIVTSLGEIAGPWDIASFAGYQPTRLGADGLRRAYVDIGPLGLSYTIECNYSGNAAHIDEGGILHDDSDGSRLQTLMGCGPEREARDAALFGFFASSPKVIWIEGGRVRVSANGTDLILERPQSRRLANIPAFQEISGRWVPRMASRTLEGNGHEGWGFQEPGLLTIRGNELTYSGCEGATFSFDYGADARIRLIGPGEADCGTDTSERMLLSVLRNDPLVERTAGGGIALTAGNEVIGLQSEESARAAEDNLPPPPVSAPPPPPPPPPPPHEQ
jgi:hypothetical protein